MTTDKIEKRIKEEFENLRPLFTSNTSSFDFNVSLVVNKIMDLIEDLAYDEFHYGYSQGLRDGA